MRGENIYNVPNLLSSYRLISSPFLVYLACTRQEQTFLIFLAVNILTDILDGAIARAFKLQTKFGARLDSLADAGTYIVVACGIIQFKWQDLSHFTPWLWVFGGAFVLPYIVSYLRFRKFPSLHLYSCKIGGTIDGIFLFCLFIAGFSQWLFLLAISWGILSFLEMTAVLVTLNELRSNCKGICWVLRDNPIGTTPHNDNENIAVLSKNITPVIDFQD